MQAHAVRHRWGRTMADSRRAEDGLDRCGQPCPRVQESEREEDAAGEMHADEPRPLHRVGLTVAAGGDVARIHAACARDLAGGGTLADAIVDVTCVEERARHA